MMSSGGTFRFIFSIKRRNGPLTLEIVKMRLKSGGVVHFNMLWFLRTAFDHQRY